MKSLDQVAPGTPVSELPFTIDGSGYYFLTGDLALSTGSDAIVVQVDDVTIDLKGFTLDGSGSSGAGVKMQDRTNVEVRNGTIRGFGTWGVVDSFFGTSSGHRAVDLRLMGNGSGGVLFEGDGHTIRDCTVRDSGAGGYGIFAGSDAVVTGNVVDANGGIGIGLSPGSLSRGNVVSNSGGTGIECAGATVTGNELRQNNDDDLAGNSGIGILFGCLVTDNMTHDNKRSNIRVAGADSVVEGNTVLSSAKGILFVDDGNFYAGNRASGNATDYDLGATTQTDGGNNFSF